MSIRQFFRFVEIQTKIASIFPLFLGSLYVLFQHQCFNWLTFILFTLSLLTIDMFTTGLNNLYDARRERLEQGYAPAYQNVLLASGLSLRLAEIILLGLLLISLISGLLLVYHTNGWVLLLGLISFGISFAYSYGPVPINHTPLGELISGLTMGGLITFIAVYIHVIDLDWIVWQQGILSLKLGPMVRVWLISGPLILATANIMLANNMCDLALDRSHGRYTLVHYIGLDWSKRLFSLNYLIAYLLILVLILLRMLPWSVALCFLTLPKLYAQVRSFVNRVSKSDTFRLAVKNYWLLALSYCLGLGIWLVLA